jgi:hypothetical protein
VAEALLRARLRYHVDVRVNVSVDSSYERGVPGGTLSMNATSYSHHGRYADLLLQMKIPTAEPAIEPGTS